MAARNDNNGRVALATDLPPAAIRSCLHPHPRLAYLCAGETGPPVVMLHGWGAFKELWWSTLRGLGRDHRCFALDVPGHGDSPLGGAHTIPLLADVVAQFCADLGLTEIILMGHSMGGAIAAELTLAHPDLVHRLVLVDAAVDAHLMPIYARVYLLPQLGWGLLRLTQLIGRRARPLSLRIPHEHGGGWIRPWLRRSSYLAMFEPEGLHRVYRSLFATQTGDRLAQIAVPTLVLSGQFDSLVPPANSHRLADLIPGASYHQVSGALHNPMDERPYAFEKAVRRFLRSAADL
ncbi:alpha/beta fold hydrolase [Candidatus Chloroploca asiatica]|uniref:Alpha/beta hydrolase n=1 Tax=Candidatus Chloroploca asiatica TaxID=1506545 RepID=A0A2H3KRA1_9CHLR|nr:alpha/beta hydrolase [Candidatus Chloroploca asiatica]PDV97721.1 alpha/beta hydrolase [Candidatus Chloroploca asiatica]